jgi:hypothetical protein
MITDSFKLVGDTLEESGAVMFDSSNLSVDRLWAIGDFPSMNPANALVTKTDSKDWDVARLQNLCADTEILMLRSQRARGDTA